MLLNKRGQRNWLDKWNSLKRRARNSRHATMDRYCYDFQPRSQSIGSFLFWWAGHWVSSSIIVLESCIWSKHSFRSRRRARQSPVRDNWILCPYSLIMWCCRSSMLTGFFSRAFVTRLVTSVLVCQCSSGKCPVARSSLCIVPTFWSARVGEGIWGWGRRGYASSIACRGVRDHSSLS